MVDMPLQDREELDLYCRIARTFREEVGYETDMVPQLIVLGEKADEVAQIGMINVPANLMDEIIVRAVEDAPWGFPPRRIILTVDAYVDIAKVKGNRGTAMRAAAAFKAGKPGVGEAVCVTYASPDLKIMAILPYRWSLTDGWEWDEMILKEELT